MRFIFNRIPSARILLHYRGAAVASRHRNREHVRNGSARRSPEYSMTYDWRPGVISLPRCPLRIKSRLVCPHRLVNSSVPRQTRNVSTSTFAYLILKQKLKVDDALFLSDRVSVVRIVKLCSPSNGRHKRRNLTKLN